MGCTALHHTHCKAYRLCSRSHLCHAFHTFPTKVLSDVPRELVHNEWGRTVGPSTIRTGNMTVPHFKVCV